MRLAATLLALAPVATAPACLATGEGDDADGEGAFSISVSAADTALVLDLVNYPRVDAATLDGAAALDKRAAAGIIAHRDGGDAVATTTDDNRFDTLAELDDVKYVGDAALSRLIAYAHAHPAPASVTVESVPFSGWQAEAVVWGVNQATLAELDDGLDARAANNLIVARPFASLDQIAAVPYVGASVLRGLRAESPLWWRTMVGSQPPAPCTITVSGRADANATDLSNLLDTATTLDWPWAVLGGVSLPDCADARLTSPQVGAVASAVAGYARSAWGSGIDPSSSGLVAGGSHFIGLVTTARDVIQDRVDSGQWIPSGPDEQAMLDHLPATVDALIAGPTANPADYVELPLRTDAEECSEYGSLLIQLSTHRGWLIHQFPRC